MDASLLAELEEEDAKKCEMTEVFVFLAFLHFSLAGREMRYIVDVYCCLGGETMRDVGVQVVLLRSSVFSKW